MVDNRGWLVTRDMRIGDRLGSSDGKKVSVEGVADSGRIDSVYNVEVDEYHTDFRGLSRMELGQMGS